MFDVEKLEQLLNFRLAKPAQTIREHTDELLYALMILYKLGYLKESIYHQVKQCCEYHDYGKISDEFQKRVTSKTKIKFNSSKEVAHNVLSLCFVCKDEFDSLNDYYQVCYAILNHHHIVDNFKEADEKGNLIDAFIEEYGGTSIGRRLLKRLKEQETNPQAILLKGFLHKCDYAASGDYEIEYPNDFLLDSLNNNLLSTWKEENASACWNELQQFCMEHTDRNVIVIANTGMGKTEAGLLWIGDNKGFFILPLRTAINAIYDRICIGIIKNEKIDKRVSLLHSDTLAYYLAKNEDENFVEEDEIIKYAEQGKNLSIPLTISTLDQLFNFVYKHNGFELKLATLSYSKLVIDEIQAYSPDLLAYLVFGLEAVVKMGGKFAILTATLPPFIRDYIEENIKSIAFIKFTQGDTRHHLKVIERELDISFIVDHFNKKSGKTIVICNTVKKAQEVYDSLMDELEGVEINLIHSKFIKRDRASKEDAIKKDGKTEVKKDVIWVATSIVEASLDIDFDYLFTEINDLNGLFQRLGRVNRKGKKDEMLFEPNCYVFTMINENILTNEDGSRGFIDRNIYELSKKALRGFEGLLTEEKKVELIEASLTSENLQNSYFVRKYDEMKNYIKNLYVGEKNLAEVQKQFRNITAYNVIPEEVYFRNEDEIDAYKSIFKQVFRYEVTKTKTENNIIKRKLRLEKVKARKFVDSFTVSVGIYDLDTKGKYSILKGDEFPFVRCKYDEHRGFARYTNEDEKFDMFY